jgi:hypothetical protein
MAEGEEGETFGPDQGGVWRPAPNVRRSSREMRGRSASIFALSALESACRRFK